MAHSSPVGDKNNELDRLTCPICLEIYDRPMVISCGHTFCETCLGDFEDLAEPRCPMCRIEFDPSQQRRHTEVERLLVSQRGACKGCGKKMPLSKLRSHMLRCSKLKPVKHSFKPVAATSQPIPSDLPNRSTFKCPYCGVSNLDNQGLLKHCNEQHRDSSTPVVCPVCAIMPWGNPDQKSANFISHLNLRHKFEYDTYVDYQQDDSAMLEAALKASMGQT